MNVSQSREELEQLQRTPSPKGKNPQGKGFLIQEHLVELMGVEPTTSKLRI
jgi:hypothetical protein